MINDVVVIMSVYESDNLDYLKEAVESILSQTVSCDFVIFKDGFINSEMEAYIQSIMDNELIKVMSCSENKGLAHALNSMIDYALNEGYKFIARMDSDDISRKDRIEKQLCFFLDENNKDIGVVGSYCREFGASFALECKKVPLDPQDLTDFSITRCPFVHPTVMFRSTIFEGGVRYPTNTNLTEDMALWFILLQRGIRFSNLDCILLDYRLNELTLSRRKGLRKALSEVKLRLYYMKALNRVSFSNLSSIGFRLFFHFLPIPILRLIYKKCR
ncbi:TPA: glycosyltransferase [Vibrio vulnificus]